MMDMQEQVKVFDPNYRYGVDLDEKRPQDLQRVLIVEDDKDTVFLLKHILLRAGFGVMSAHDGEEALRKVVDLSPSLVLLDLMMPGVDGWSMLEYLRQASNIPVIVVSAVAGKEDVVRALSSGVDDYITKPFFNDELIARISTVLRRANPPAEISRLVFPQIDFVIDLSNQEVHYANKHIQLTEKEFAVLAVLAKHAPAIVSYPVISKAVWGQDLPAARKRTKYLIYLLRRKLEGLTPDRELLINVGRLGYKLQTQFN